MAIGNMVVFNQNMRELTIELFAQQVEKFNAASNGAIVLTSDGFYGDFLENAFYSTLEAAQRRVDIYATNGAVSATALAQIAEDSVKVAGGFGPILFEPIQMIWNKKSEAEALQVASTNLSALMLKDQLNAGVSSAVAAIANQASATNDISATAGLSYTAMNTSHALFGDSSMNLSAQIMNGTAYHKLVGANLANTPQLFQAQNVLVVDILGKPVVVTDVPALYEAGTPNKLKVLSLASGGIVVNNASEMVSNIETTNGKERIETTMQADYTFGVGLKGYTWDKTNGGKSPTDADLGTGTNWDLVASDIKNSAGVITIADASK